MYAIFVTLFLELQNENIKYFKQIIKCQKLIFVSGAKCRFPKWEGDKPIRNIRYYKL